MKNSSKFFLRLAKPRRIITIIIKIVIFLADRNGHDDIQIRGCVFSKEAFCNRYIGRGPWTDRRINTFKARCEAASRYLHPDPLKVLLIVSYETDFWFAFGLSLEKKIGQNLEGGFFFFVTSLREINEGIRVKISVTMDLDEV